MTAIRVHGYNGNTQIGTCAKALTTYYGNTAGGRGSAVKYIKTIGNYTAEFAGFCVAADRNDFKWISLMVPGYQSQTGGYSTARGLYYYVP
ncbi:MAG: hypothetical protein ACOY0T_14605 [Myxococcota bacterium]